MEDEDKLVFLDSSEAEENFLRGNTSTPTSGRRLSAAGKAALLKKKNLIPPLHSPTDRRVSLPRASKSTAMPVVEKRKPPKAGEGDEQQPRPEPTSSEKFIQEQLAALTAMIGGVKDDIGRAESRTAEKIDTKVDDLAGKLGARMTKAETDLARISAELATTRNQLETVMIAADEREKALPKLVETLLSSRTDTPAPDQRPGRRHRPLALTDTTMSTRTLNEERYWTARKSLRLWPVEGVSTKEAVLTFLEKKLLCPPGRVALNDFDAKCLYSPPDLIAQNQVLVTFTSIGLRDEVKSMSKNLSGRDRKTGVQIEPPDHLRGQYQAFQRLAFQLKRKHPSLRRNVKFYDPETCLTMDIKVSSDSEWKAVSYDHAREILKKTRVRTESFTIEELESMAEVAPRDMKKRRRDTIDSDSDDDMNSTIIDLTENVDENKKQSKSSRRLCFINTNARSLEPKIRALYDCFSEKDVDFAFLTETWYQSNSALQAKLSEHSHRFALQSIVRNRTTIANNGRSYGGIAFVYRKSRASFNHFPLVNPDDHEVLAPVGKVHSIPGKVFCITVYAPPNLAQSRATKLIEYVSDVIGEAKRSFKDCSVIVAGDFNQWKIQDISQDHPDLVEIPHGPTRGDRAIDRSFVNFGRAVQRSDSLPPLETETGQESDHRVAWAEAVFEVDSPKIITYPDLWKFEKKTFAKQ